MSKNILIGFNGDIDSQILSLLLTKQAYTVSGVYYSVKSEALAIFPLKIQNKFNKDIESLNLKASELKIDLRIVDVTEQFIDQVYDVVLSSKLEFKYINYSELICRFLVNCISQNEVESSLGYYVKFLRSESNSAILMHSDFELDQSALFASSSLDKLNTMSFPLGELSFNERKKLEASFKISNANSLKSKEVDLENCVASSLIKPLVFDEIATSNINFEVSDYKLDIEGTFNIEDGQAVKVESCIYELGESSVPYCSGPSTVYVKCSSTKRLQSALMFHYTNSRIRLEFEDSISLYIGQSISIYESKHKNSKLLGFAFVESL